MTCPSCGNPNPDGAKFCSECAAPLAAVPDVSAEERKIVTVLFCDLVGFTAASDEADPEDVRARLLPFHRMLRVEIERFGGTVEKFIGDAVMAVFGAPVAHEDDAERAVRSALRILEAIEELNVAQDLGLTVRIGINSGEAVVALDAHPERGEGFVTGDVVNTASRLQGVAPVGGAVVGEQTFRLTDTVIAYETLDPVEVKGKREPIPIWRVIEATARFGAETDRTDTSPFVGREDELELLRRAFSRAVREREPQLVVVTGEPGVGKSRLIREFFGWVDDADELVTWRQGRCLPYGEGITFWALSEIVKAHAGIYETDAPETVATKLEEVVRPAIDLLEDRGWVSTRLGILAGAEGGAMGGELSQDELFTAWTRFFEGVSDEGPLVLVFDDIHWADRALLSFVERLVDRATDAPILVVATARPELRETHPEFARDLRAVAWVPLSVLSENETAELVGGILGTSALPAEVQEALVMRAAGNPLFAEQFANLLLDRQILIPKGRSYVLAEGAEIPVPANVSAIIAARLDTLPPDRKRLLHNAAVVGKVFWSGAVAQLSGLDPRSVNDGLHELSRKELVRRSRRSSVEGDDEYSFWHVLTRDTAYSQIPKAERAAKHLATADWIEHLAGERKADQAELLVHHFQEAFDLGTAAGADTAELRVRLRQALVTAGERLRPLEGPAALDRFRRAMALMEGDAHDPVEEAHIAQQIGQGERFIGMPGEEHIDRAIRLYGEAGDEIARAKCMLIRANISWQVGERDLATHQRSEAMDVLLASDSATDRAEGVIDATFWHILGGRPDEALDWLERWRDTLDVAANDPEFEARLLEVRGSARSDLGDAGGIHDLRRCVEIAEESQEVRGLGRLSGNLGYALLLLEGPSAAEATLRRGIDVEARRGFAVSEAYNRSNLCDALYEAGRWSETRDAIDWLAAASTRLGLSDVLVWAEGVRASIEDAGGSSGEPFVSVEQLSEMSRPMEPQTSIPGLLASAYRSAAASTDETAGFIAEIAEIAAAGCVGSRTKDLVPALRLCRRLGLVALAERLLQGIEAPPAPRMAAAIATGRALLAEMHQRFQESLDGYKNAIPLWTSTGCRVELAHARAGAGRTLVSLGRQAPGRDELLLARATFEELAATHWIAEVDDWLARATLKSS